MRSGDEIPVVLERGAELDLATGLLASARDGAGSTVLVEGPAGVGKTTIVRMFQATARDQAMTVLGATATPVEQSEAWAGVKRLFDAALLGAGEERRAELLDGAAANAAPALGLDLDRAPVLDPFTCIHGLYWLVANLTHEGPLVLSVDDVQWLDAPSARWVAHMATRTEDLPLVLVLGRRTGEPAAAGAMPEIEAATARVLRPKELSPEGSRALLEARLGEPLSEGIADACYEATGGNPFLLAELCTSIAEAGKEEIDATRIAQFGPHGVARSLDRRLAALGRDATSLAQALSVLGENTELAQLAAMAHLDLEPAFEAAESLANAQILAKGDPLGFNHPVLRAALYESMDGSERSRRHREGAAVLHSSGAGPERVASHLLRCQPAADGWVVERLAEAAEAAASRGASEAAAEYLRRALTEPPTGDEGLRLRFRYALARLDQGDRAISDLTRAVLALPDSERPAAALQASRTLGLFTEHEAALEVCGSISRVGIDPGVASRLSDEMVVNMLNLHPSAWREGGPAKVLEEAPSPPDPGAEALRDVSNALVAVKAGQPVDVERLAAAVQGLVPEFPSLAFAAAGFGLVWCDELDTARMIADVGLTYSRNVGSPTGAAQWSSVAAAVALRAGQVPEAIGLASASVEFNIDRPPSTLAWPLATLIEAMELRGELDEADAAANLVPDRTDGFLSTATLTEVVGRLALARGEIERATRLLEDAGRRFDYLGFAAPPISAWRSGLAEALALAGEMERANLLAHEQLQIATAAKTNRSIGSAQRALGLSSAGDDRLAHLNDAVATFRISPARIELARTLMVLGSELARRGQRKDARAPLSEAMQIAQECGAPGLEAQVRAVLVATGARPRRRDVSGVGSLTPSELRVAHLVAAGMTNRAAAQALFLSEKTVEGHLGRIFRKLDVASRTELAERLDRGTNSG